MQVVRIAAILLVVLDFALAVSAALASEPNLPVLLRGSAVSGEQFEEQASQARDKVEEDQLASFENDKEAFSAELPPQFEEQIQVQTQLPTCQKKNQKCTAKGVGTNLRQCCSGLMCKYSTNGGVQKKVCLPKH